MNVVVAEPAVERTATPARHLLLHGVSWREYLRLNRVLNHNGYRVAYDRGRLEARSPSFVHDADSRFVSRLVEALTIAAKDLQNG